MPAAPHRRPDALAERRRIGPPVAVERLGSVDDLCRFVATHPLLFVLTGAGCSTDSGIPDYRSADGTWKRGRPVEFSAFVRDVSTRRRYWARSLVGWRSFGQAVPNDAHRALAALERQGRSSLVVTQNVDGLHQAAGSRRVVDLHGRLDRVICLTCGHRDARARWQAHLERLNPDWVAAHAPAAPDGDADLDGVDFEAFVVPPCERCGGLVKPDVVFFGENVPPWRHAQATAALAGCDAVLVAGSSLMVQSGFRYARAAARAGRPVVAVNLGRTRADEFLTLKVEAPVGPALTTLAAAD